MKKLIFVSILIVTSAISIVAQSTCPTISVTGPSGGTFVGDSMTFTAKVEGIDLDKIKYIWTVSLGKIADERGTSIIKVATTADMTGYTITAKVEISGLPQECSNYASAKGEVGMQEYIHSMLIDKFSISPPRIPKEQFKFIAIELVNDPASQLYILENFKRGISHQVIKKRITNTFAFFTQTAKISPERITIQISNGKENLTQIWFVPAGADAPNEDLEKVEIRGDNYKKKLEELFPSSKKKPQTKGTKRL